MDEADFSQNRIIRKATCAQVFYFPNHPQHLDKKGNILTFSARAFRVEGLRICMNELKQNAAGALRRIAEIRQKVIQLSFQAKSAHLGSSLSIIEMLDAVLSVSNLRPESVQSPTRDRIVLSKGHAAMGFYATYHAWGLVEESDLATYLKNGSVLWGHVTKVSKYPTIDYSTGSLGHGIGLALGHAMGYRLRGGSGRVFCILSDGECNEGSIWEAALLANHHRVQNLTVLVDNNGLQGLDACDKVARLEPFAQKWSSFGWDVRELDGHDWDGLCQALSEPQDRPKVLLCKTVKGKGIPEIESTVASHYQPAKESFLELGGKSA